MLGSSPRVWGQDGFFTKLPQVVEDHPPRVGGTRWYTAKKRRAAERDHPHACGDKAYDKWLTLRNGGSSPRVWGQERNGDKCDKKAEDHPHACGGQAFHRLRKCNNHRIIPTRVGTSHGRLTARSAAVGSSPRVWGQVIPSYVSPFGVGIIPHACGDKLQVKGSMVQAIGSSPRVWGDKLGFPIACCIAMGSSPRVWGTRTSPFHKKVGMYKDHPHACGDKQTICLSGR